MIFHGYVLRPASEQDLGFLTQMLVAAVNWMPGRQYDPRQLLRDPAVAHYVDGWPRPGDFGTVAVDAHGEPVGAAWARCFTADDPGYGFVAPDVPEVSVAVVESWRGRGVGRALLRAIATSAAGRGLRALSLSVERANQAQRLYRSEGFVVVSRGRDSDTMVMDLDAVRCQREGCAGA